MSFRNPVDAIFDPLPDDVDQTPTGSTTITVRPDPQVPAPEVDRSPIYRDALSVLQSDKAQSQQRIQSNVQQATETSPDRTAEILRIANQLGVPAAVVENDYDAMKKRASLQSSPYLSADLQKQSPTLASWLAADPYHASLADKDYEALSTLESGIRVAKNIGGAIGAGAMIFSEGVWGLAQLKAEWSGDKELARYYADVARNANYLAMESRGNYRGAGWLESQVYSGVESVVMAAPTLLLGLGAGEIPALLAMGGATGGQSFAQGRREGLSLGKATAYGAIQGTIEALTEKIPLERALHDIKVGSTLGHILRRQVTSEIGTELVATTFQNLNDWAMLPSNKDKKFGDYLSELPEALAATVVSTLVTVGVNSAMFRAAATLQGTVTQAAADSKLRERSPEKFAELVNQMAKDSPASTVYIPKEKWDEFWQSQNEDPAQKALEWTANPAAYEQSVDTGNLDIGIGQFAANIVSSPEINTALSPHVRMFSPDAPTQSEYQQGLTDMHEAAKEMQAAIDKAAEQGVQPEEEQSDLHRAIVAQQLADPGFHAMTEREGVDPVVVANTYAAAQEVIITRLAKRVGADPMDILAEHGLKLGDQGLLESLMAVQAASTAVEEPGGVQPQPEGTSSSQAAPADSTAAAQAPPEAGPDGAVLYQAAKAETAPKPPRETAPLALAPARVTRGALTVSTRVPWGKNSQRREDVLTTRLSTVDELPEKERAAFTAKLADKMRETRQVTDAEAKLPPDQLIQAAVQRFKRNIKFLYDLMPAAWRERAKLWYAGAHRLSWELAAEKQIAFHQATGVLAVLSPQMDWFKNVSLAERVIDGYQHAEKTNPVFTPELMQHYIARALESTKQTYRIIERKDGPEAAKKYLADKKVGLALDKKNLTGRAWHDMLILDQAKLLRMIDETTNSPHYRVILPEGERGDLNRNVDGSLSKIGWGTYDFIASAISILRDGSVENINEKLGQEHKVRSFFNNISDPWNSGSVTIDTHAVDAALLEPFGGSEPPVKAAMGGISNRDAGISGTNLIYAEAYNQLADELGILPRELQSIAWEAVRGLFTPEQKKLAATLPPLVADLWAQVQRGTLSEEALRDRIKEEAGGIRRPAWVDTSPRVAFDEGQLRRGDVLAGRPDLSAGRSHRSQDTEGPAWGSADLADGLVVPRADVLAASRRLDLAARRATVTRLLDRFRSTATRTHEGSRARAARTRNDVKTWPDGQHTLTVWTPSNGFSDGYAKGGFGTTVIHELKPGKASAKFFHDAITKAKAAIKTGAQVYVYDRAEYAKMTLFVTPDATSGFALKDGDIVSVFNTNTAGSPRIANAMMALAVERGGNRLDCFDTMLPDIYALSGFKVVRREGWNEEFKPDGWDYETFSKFKDGRPDVVWMEYDPAALKTGPITLYQSAADGSPTTESWFYSRLQRAVELAKVDKATGRDWKNIIKGSKIGVNGEEFTLASVDQLDDKTTYTREEVKRYLSENQVQVGWWTMSDDGPDTSSVRTRAEQLYEEAVDAKLQELEDRGFGPDPVNVEVVPVEEDGESYWEVEGLRFTTEDAAQDYADQVRDQREQLQAQEWRQHVATEIDWDAQEAIATEQLQEELDTSGKLTKYAEYRLPGLLEPSTYREVHLQATGEPMSGFSALSATENQRFLSDPVLAATRRQIAFYQSKNGATVRTGDDLTRGLLHRLSQGVEAKLEYSRDEKEIAALKERLALYTKLKGASEWEWHGSAWKDGHSEYHMVDNPIVRLRFDVRGEAVIEGKRELNQDVMQKGIAAQERIKEIRREAQGPNGWTQELGTQLVEQEAIYRMAQLELVNAQGAPRETGRRFLFLEELQPPRDDEGRSEFKKMPAIFQKNWRELGLKWALRYAAENGLDGVAWTTGQQQADRYGLQTVVEAISWVPASTEDHSDVTLKLKTGEWITLLVDREGKVVETSGTEFEEMAGRPLADSIGQALAAEVMSDTVGKIEGVGLAVGGEGLAKLYDQDLPRALSKLAAVKSTGTKLTTMTLADHSKNEQLTQPAIELTPELRAAVLGGQVLFQAERGSIRIAPGETVINLFKSADLSTMLHESGHLYLQIMGSLVDKVRAGDPASWTAGQKSLVEDYDRILKFLGVQNRSQIGVAEHEQFARAFEAYLMRGQSPEPKLVGAFTRFRSWLTGIYKTIDKLGVNLNPEIVEVFDRLVASDEAIAAARKSAKMTPIFSTAEQAGMTQIEWQGYQKQLAIAHQAATNALQAKVMKELAREREKWWKEQKATLAKEVRAEVAQQPVFRALLGLQRGEAPDGTKLDGVQKISKDSIVEKYGKDRLKGLPLPYVYSVEGGLDVDEVAGAFGFTSGDELLTALKGAEKLDDVVARETDARMKQRYGNMRVDGTLREAARIEVEANGYEEVLKAELQFMARFTKTVKPIVDAAKAQVGAEEASARRAVRQATRAMSLSTEVIRAAAEERIGKLAPKDLKPGRYWSVARTEGDKASRLFAEGKYEEAVDAKQKQRLAVEMHKAAAKAVEEAEAIRRFADRLSALPAQKRLGKAGETYQAQVNALLDRFEFAVVPLKTLENRASLVEWVKDREEDGLPVDIPAEVLERAQRQNYRSLPMSTLREVRDALKTINHLAILKNHLLATKDGRTFAENKKRILDRLAEYKGTRKANVLEYRGPEKRKRSIADIFAAHTRIATLAQQLDGYEDGGPFWSMVVKPLNDAANAEVLRRAADGERFNKIIEHYYPGRQLATWSKKVQIEGVGSLSREGILAVALNWGNETSRQRLLSDPSRQWSRQNIEAILDKLDHRDWQFVQATWDFVNEYWQEISDKHFRLNGVRPEKVQAAEVSTKYGTFRGGYYPLKYDSRMSARSRQVENISEAKLQLAGAYIANTTRRGHEKARLENVKSSVKLELGVLFSHLDQVIHDLTHHEALLDVNRILRDRQIAQQVFSILGDTGAAQFHNAIGAIAVGNRPGDHMLDKAASFMKTGTQISGLGLNLWTALQQPTGIFNGAARVGPKWVAKGLYRWLSDASTMENTMVWIREVSPFMRDRAKTQNQDLMDLQKRLSEPGGWFDSMVRQATGGKHTQASMSSAFLWHIALAQRVADVPTWLGQYEKSKTNGRSDEDAVAEADQAVRDSQGGGQVVDLAHVQRGGPLARMFMVFYSYGNTVYNQTARAAGKTDFKSAASVTRFLGDLSMIYLMPSLMVTLLSRLLRGSGGDDDDWWDVTKDVLADMGGTALNTMVGLREFGGLLRNSNRGYEGPAGMRLMQTFYRLVPELQSMELDHGFWSTLNQAGGILLRYPAGQVQRTIDGWVALQEGTTENPLALIFGPPRKK